MTVPDASRNHHCRPGDQFRDAIDLPGWEHQSIWGYDQPTGTFFAQLWTNGTTSDAPEVWLSGVPRPYPRPENIALDILEHTHTDPLTVIHALGLADPNPTLRPPEQITTRITELPPEDQDRYAQGWRQALGWTLGTEAVCPGSGFPWQPGPPTAAYVDAEHRYVTARVYRGDHRDYHAGADEALWWALGR